MKKSHPIAPEHTAVRTALWRALHVHNFATFQQVAKLAPGSTFATTFMLSLELVPPDERGMMEFVMKKASASGTPFVSLFSPAEIVALAKESGFKKAEYVPASKIFDRYFARRTDEFTAGTAEAFLVAQT